MGWGVFVLSETRSSDPEPARALQAPPQLETPAALLPLPAQRLFLRKLDQVFVSVMEGKRRESADGEGERERLYYTYE